MRRVPSRATQKLQRVGGVLLFEFLNVGLAVSCGAGTGNSIEQGWAVRVGHKNQLHSLSVIRIFKPLTVSTNPCCFAMLWRCRAGTAITYSRRLVSLVYVGYVLRQKKIDTPGNTK